MSFLQPALTLLGIFLCITQLVVAAPHCAKPVLDKRNCSVTYGRFNSGDQYTFENRKNLTCLGGGEGYIDIEVTFTRNGKEMNLHYISSGFTQQAIWINLECSQRKDTNTGFNLFQLNELEENDIVLYAKCWLDWTDVEDYKKTFINDPKHIVIDWTPEIGQQN